MKTRKLTTITKTVTTIHCGFGIEDTIHTRRIQDIGSLTLTLAFDSCLIERFWRLRDERCNLNSQSFVVVDITLRHYKSTLMPFNSIGRKGILFRAK